jgi:hypothetical protein
MHARGHGQLARARQAIARPKAPAPDIVAQRPRDLEKGRDLAVSLHGHGELPDLSHSPDRMRGRAL